MHGCEYLTYRPPGADAGPGSALESTETEESAVLSTRYGRPAALQMLAMPLGIAALCALQCIPSRAALTANSSVSVNCSSGRNSRRSRRRPRGHERAQQGGEQCEPDLKPVHRGEVAASHDAVAQQQHRDRDADHRADLARR